jgi:hypothetical protein
LLVFAVSPCFDFLFQGLSRTGYSMPWFIIFIFFQTPFVSFSTLFVLNFSSFLLSVMLKHYLLCLFILVFLLNWFSFLK